METQTPIPSSRLLRRMIQHLADAKGIGENLLKREQKDIPLPKSGSTASSGGSDSGTAITEIGNPAANAQALLDCIAQIGKQIGVLTVLRRNKERTEPASADPDRTPVLVATTPTPLPI